MLERKIFMHYLIRIALCLMVASSAIASGKDPRGHYNRHEDRLGYVVTKANPNAVKGSIHDCLIDIKSRVVNGYWQGCIKALGIEPEIQDDTDQWDITNVSQLFVGLGFDELAADPTIKGRKVYGISHNPSRNQFNEFLTLLFRVSNPPLPKSTDGHLLIFQSGKFGNIGIKNTLVSLGNENLGFSKKLFFNFQNSRQIKGVPNGIVINSSETWINSSHYDFLAMADWINEHYSKEQTNLYIVCDYQIRGLLEWAIKTKNPKANYTLLFHMPDSYQYVMCNEFNHKWVKEVYKDCPISMGWAVVSHLAGMIKFVGENVVRIEKLNQDGLEKDKLQEEQASMSLNLQREKEHAELDKKREQERARKIAEKKRLLAEKRKKANEIKEAQKSTGQEEESEEELVKESKNNKDNKKENKDDSNNENDDNENNTDEKNYTSKSLKIDDKT